MASNASLILPSVRIPVATDLTSLTASNNQVLLGLNTQLQQISSAFTLTKPTTTIDGSFGGVTVGNIIMGSTNYIRGGATGYNAGTGFWLGYDSNSPAGYKFFVGSSVGNKMTWDGSSLSITGTITATTGVIGGWTVGTTALTAGSGATRVGLDSGGINPAIYAGSNTPATAPFRVTNTGDLTCSNATITGATIDGTSTLGGRVASILASAINASGNLVTQVVNTALDTSTKKILDGFTFGTSGAIQIGTYSAGVSGDIKISPNGIVGRNASNVTTFSIDGTTGAATFGGQLVAPSGSIGGWALSATTISALLGNIVLDSVQGSVRAGMSDYATGTGFWLGNTAGTPRFSIGSSSNYLRWDGTNVLLLGGSSPNNVIIDSGGFTVGTASGKRVAVGTFSGNAASLNFFNSSNQARLGLYLDSGTTPYIRFDNASGGDSTRADWYCSTGSFLFQLTSTTGTYGTSTFNVDSSTSGTAYVSLSGPNGAGGLVPQFNISNSTTGSYLYIESTRLLFSNDTNLYRYSANILRTDDAFIVGGDLTVSVGSVIYGSGAGITSLDASNLSTGTVPTARLGSGSASSANFLRGDQTWSGITSSNVSGLAASATTDTTNAGNISSGTLSASRLPNPLNIGANNIQCGGIKYDAHTANVISFYWDGSNVRAVVDGSTQGTIPNP